MLSRRDVLKATGQTCLAAGFGPFSNRFGLVESMVADHALRCINVVNFLRGVEPRGPVDLFLPLQKQMELALLHKLPTTWLLQFDALVSGPFVGYLKEHMPKDHEVGVWFEMNEMHCKAAGVEWRGRPGYEWDHYPSVAFTIGYSQDERISLADAFMHEFKKTWGTTPKSVASWNLDAVTMEYLADKYHVDAFAVCRDQIATDGFTIWGAPIAGYYPSRSNCWSPAVDKKNQISVPVFRMLGQDPVYYYQHGFPMPGGKRGGGPDTMEPVWSAGRSPEFVKNFLSMIAESPTLKFAYAQLGQENNFGWPEMESAYPRQMKALADLRASGHAHVETMGETGRRFKESFTTTPPQAQIMLEDPFGNEETPERSVWYQSRFYRADLHFHGDLVYLRDITVYSDANPQPFLEKATRLQDVEQRMPAVLDGYHWSDTPGSSDPGAGGFVVVDGVRITMTGKPTVREAGNTLFVDVPVSKGGTLRVKFEERRLTVSLSQQTAAHMALSFEWSPERSAFVKIQGRRAEYSWQGLEYGVTVSGTPTKTPHGWSVLARDSVVTLELAQDNV